MTYQYQQKSGIVSLNSIIPLWQQGSDRPYLSNRHNILIYGSVALIVL